MWRDECKVLIDKIVLFDKSHPIIKNNSYNIFSALGIETREVIACRFMADLLNPMGHHNCGIKFLELFFKEVWQFNSVDRKDLENAIVTTEYAIDDNRRIDIVIEYRNHFIPIEVKIYAGEQSAQCSDYLKFARKKDKTAKIYYLTRFGTMPSEKSLDGIDSSQVVCLSFQKNISDWLKECVGISNEPLKTIICQFEEVVHKITDQRYEEKITMISDELIKSPDYLKAGMEIAASVTEAKCKLMRAVFAEFENQMITILSKYSLQRENKVNWHEYRDCVNSRFYNQYSTYPGIDYLVTKATLQHEYQLWFRIEVEHRLFAGFCLFDPNAESQDGKGNKIVSCNQELWEDLQRYLDIKEQHQEDWWVIWDYLPTGNRQESNEIPNFKDMNEKAIELVDDKKRAEFVAMSIQKLEEVLLCLLK